MQYSVLYSIQLFCRVYCSPELCINVGGGYRSSRRLYHSHAIIKGKVGIRKLTHCDHVLWESMVCRIDMLYEHKVKGRKLCGQI